MVVMVKATDVAASLPRDAVTKDTATNIRVEMARQRRYQSEIAELLGMSRQNVSRRLMGKTPLRVDEIVKIAGLLAVPVESLIAGGGSTSNADESVSA